MLGQLMPEKEGASYIRLLIMGNYPFLVTDQAIYLEVGAKVKVKSNNQDYPIWKYLCSRVHS